MTTGILAAAGLLLATAAPVVAAPLDDVILGAGSGTAIAGEYIVKLKDTASLRAGGVAAGAAGLAKGYGGRLGHVWDRALRGFSVSMSEAEAKRLAADPDVEYVQQQQVYRMYETEENPPSWGLDRIDQRSKPLDNAYTYDATGGAGVHAYIVDSGIRVTHADFGGRAENGFDFVDNDTVAQDCHGHGTHVAGTAGGNQYGVAKKVQLVAVRVFGCTGVTSDQRLLDGINWVIVHAVKPAVINLSLGSVCVDGSNNPAPCPAGAKQAVIDAEKAAIAAGITVVTAAGNENADACNNPVGAAGGTINVGALDLSDEPWKDDATSGSNFGFCVDIWAPGKDIVSAGKNSDTDFLQSTGTSMAAPHVTGAVALLMGDPAFAGATPGQIAAELDRRASVDKIVNLDNASPNKLLYTAPPPVAGGSSIALTRNADGRLELAGVGKDGFMYVGAQPAANASGWGPFTKSVTNGWSTVGAEPQQDNRIELCGLTPAGEIWHRHQATANANTWTPLSKLDGLLASVAVARTSTSRLEMFGANPQGQAFHRLQANPNSTTWTPWTPFPGGNIVRSITADTRPDGRTVVVATDNHRQALFAIQAVAGTDTWSDFAVITPPTGPRDMTEVAIAHNSDGSLEVAGTNGESGVWHTTQVGESWSPWVPLSSTKNLRHLAAETNADGRMQVVGVDNTGAVWQSAQNAAGSSVFSAWSKIDGLLLRS